MTARPLYKADELARANEQISRLQKQLDDLKRPNHSLNNALDCIARLEARLADEKKQLLIAAARCDNLERRLTEERVLRVAAEKNSAQWHAKLLKAKIEALP